jgi:hypothetical protein
MTWVIAPTQLDPPCMIVEDADLAGSSDKKFKVDRTSVERQKKHCSSKIFPFSELVLHCRGALSG